MDSLVRRLSMDELYDAALAVDAVEVLTDELIYRTGSATEPTERWMTATGELAVVADPGTGERCAMPAAGLRAYRAAALTALAARQLLAAGVVTASVIGSGAAAQLLLMVIARHVPDVSEIAICPLGGGNDVPVIPQVIDQLDLAGIELRVTTRVDDAVFGATLVAVADIDSCELRIECFAKGAVVVNASDRDLPDDLVDSVDQIYVDDLALVGASVRATGRRCHIEADLGHVFTGEHAGRTDIDHVVLVELLNTRVLDLPLAMRIHRTWLARCDPAL